MRRASGARRDSSTEGSAKTERHEATEALSVLKKFSNNRKEKKLMAKKKIVYGNGLRGCFLTLIKWPILLIGTGIVCLIFHAILETIYPKMEPLIRAFLSGFSAVALIRIVAYVVRTFLGFATAEEERGVVSLDRDLRGGDSKTR
jgi:hypothetical protein